MAKPKIISRIPLQHLWNEAGTLPHQRKRYLLPDEVKSVLDYNDTTPFVIANIGSPLYWIAASERFDFWKNNFRNLPDPNDEFYLDDYPGHYVFLASEWTEENGDRIILFEKLH